MSLILNLAFGPALYKVYKNGDMPSHIYQSNVAERFANMVLKWLRISWMICSWTSPFIVVVLYRRGIFSYDGIQTCISYGLSFFTMLFAAYTVRAFGRFINPEYFEFLEILTTFQQNPTTENKLKLSRYDCSFSAWPVEFSVPLLKNSSSWADWLKCTPSYSSIPLCFLSYICVKTIGIRLLYPGCVSMFQSLISQALIEGREKLIEEHRGIRTKIKASDGNYIDTMFVDRRRSNQEKGDVLVICSEGNAGFYEIGSSVTPLDAGYSVLAWNHPGFSGSTGKPLPKQEQNAIDSVVQYAMNHLGFELSNTILFAWSIGGYSASWAAMMYPDVRSVILDATFDHIQPLAIARMPPSWRGLIELAMPYHLNLNNAELLCKYSGKVLLVRRMKDEMISTCETAPLTSNRGNNLLESLLKHRYPKLCDSSTIEVLRNWLASEKNEQNAIWDSLNISDDACMEVIIGHSDTRINFPSDLGDELTIQEKEKLIIFLAKKYMIDYDSTHCTPLPASYFREPKFLM